MLGQGTCYYPGVDSAEKRIKHLEMIQGVINRMGQNSFALKTWAVTLVGALFALAADKANPAFLFVSFVPVFAFWILDGFYLRQERLYRDLYDRVRKSEVETDFSMSPVDEAESKSRTWIGAIFSKTLLIFYGILIATVVVIMRALVLFHAAASTPNP